MMDNIRSNPFQQHANNIFNYVRKEFKTKGILVLTSKSIWIIGSPYPRDAAVNDNEAK